MGPHNNPPNKLHLSWAVYLWRTTYEPMCRSNLFWSPEKGGLVLVNVELKLTAMHLLYLLDIRNLFLQAATQCLVTAHLAL